MYKDGGLLPRGPVAGDDSLVMTGSPVTSFIAGAMNKGIRDFDADLAYEAMLDAQSIGGLFDKAPFEYVRLGRRRRRARLPRPWLRAVRSSAAARSTAAPGETLEYAYQDWALAQLARRLGKRGINIAQFARRRRPRAAHRGSAGGRRAAVRSGSRPGRRALGADGTAYPGSGSTGTRRSTSRRWCSVTGQPDSNARTLRFSDGSGRRDGVPTEARSGRRPARRSPGCGSRARRHWRLNVG